MLIYIDLSRSIIDAERSIINNDHKLDRILESTSLDKYELIDLPMEQHDDSSQKYMGVITAPTLDTRRTTGLATVKGVQWNCMQELTLARGLLCLPAIERLLVLGYEMVAQKQLARDSS